MCKPGDVLRERANCTSFVRNFAASGTFAVRPATCYWWAPLRNPTRKGTDTSLVALIQVSWYQMPLVGRALPIPMLWDCLPEEGTKIWREQSVTKKIFWASLFVRYSIYIQFHHFLVVCLMGMLLTKKSRSASLAYSALPSFHSELELHWKYRTGAKKARFWYHKRIHLNFHLSISISAWWSHWFFSTPISPQYQ